MDERLGDLVQPSTTTRKRLLRGTNPAAEALPRVTAALAA